MMKVVLSLRSDFQIPFKILFMREKVLKVGIDHMGVPFPSTF